ncbi:MAG: hypothetical protein NT105_03620 [Verrucomicrobia bacterium]|nr:hypothetical protein [Verrucomicrobiota bacterium]
MTRDEQHDWGKDCEKCSRCESKRKDTHQWSGGKCSVCGKTQDAQHDSSKNRETRVQFGGVIEIATLADLQAIQNELSGHYCLVADIDASETKNWNDDKGFAPIGSANQPFAGILDGNGYAIRNLFINRGWEDDVGLLGVLSRSGQVRNLKLVDVSVSGNKYVGGLAGASRGSITACQASGQVSSNDQSVGGLVGSNFSSITKCHASGGVSGNKVVGGLVGSNFGSITECEASGEVSGKVNVGGLVGYNEGNITECQASGGVSGNNSELIGGLVGCNEGDITECQASGEVLGNKLVGGLVGYNKATVTKSYWDIQTTGQRDSRGNGEGKTSSEMKQRAVFVDWDFEEVWQIEEGKSYPTLRCFANKRL